MFKRAIYAAALAMITSSLAISPAQGLDAAPIGQQPTVVQVAPAQPVAAKAKVSQNRRALQIALAQRGDPYRYGAAGPSAFDCSGLTSFAYRNAGRPIPRTTDGQKAGLRPVANKNKQLGDLIVFHRGGNAYHVGIYVGHNQIVHAPYSGTRVRVESIWTSSYVVRRP